MPEEIISLTIFVRINARLDSFYKKSAGSYDPSSVEISSKHELFYYLKSISPRWAANIRSLSFLRIGFGLQYSLPDLQTEE